MYYEVEMPTEPFNLSVKKYPIKRQREGLPHTEGMRWNITCRRADPNDSDVQKIREGWALAKGVSVPPQDTEFEAIKCDLYEDEERTRNPMSIIIDQFSGEIVVIKGAQGAGIDVVVDDWPVYERTQKLADKVEIGYELGKVVEHEGRGYYVSGKIARKMR